MTVVDTLPFCGQCGWDVVASNLNDDHYCDACGADIVYYSKGHLPPAVTSLEEAAGTATMTFVANTGADSTDIRWQITGTTADDGGVVEGITSPYDLLQAMQIGDTMYADLRSVLSGIVGPWGAVYLVTKSV